MKIIYKNRVETKSNAEKNAVGVPRFNEGKKKEKQKMKMNMKKKNKKLKNVPHNIPQNVPHLIPIDDIRALAASSTSLLLLLLGLLLGRLSIPSGTFFPLF